MKRLGLILPLLVVTASAACDEKSSTDSSDRPAAAAASKPAKPASTTAKKPTGDAAELTEMSKKLVEATASKDIDTIVSYLPKEKREKTKEELGPGGEDHEDLFGPDSTEFQLASAAKGKVGPVRVKDGKEARVKYGEKGDEVFVFEFAKDGGKWLFHGWRSPGREDFASWGKKLD